MSTIKNPEYYRVIPQGVMVLIFVSVILNLLALLIFPSTNTDIVFRMNRVTEVILMGSGLGLLFAWFFRKRESTFPKRSAHFMAGSASGPFFGSLYGQYINIADRIELSHYFEAVLFTGSGLMFVVITFLLVRIWSFGIYYQSN